MAWVFGVFALGFWAASYEIIEMAYAVVEGGESGAAFLGSQGDIWDVCVNLFQPRDRQKHRPKNTLSGQNYYALQAK
jgi:hypothetical protein